MEKRDYKNMWVHIEHEAGKVTAVSLELCCEIRKLCDVTGEKLCGVVLGDLPADELERVLECGVDQIIRVGGTGYAHYSTDAYANAFTLLCRKHHPSAVFVGGSINGRDFAPRFAVQLNTGCTSDAMELAYDAQTGDIEFIEPAVGGKIMAVITVPKLRPQVGTIRPGTFRYAPTGKRASAAYIDEQIDFPPDKIRCRHLSFQPDAFDPSLDISDADVIVCVGNGLESKEQLPRYRELAELLGGKLGCTRPLLDREILPYKLQVGQSGVMIKPKLYLGFGISGAVNHMAGVSADILVAVNSSSEAQIFNYCDYGIVGDMNQVCDALITALKAHRPDSANH